MQASDPHILFEKRGVLGLITLNRPKALNALTHGMCIGMLKVLEEWAGDDAVSVVAIRGTGARAFCAGGDIRAMAESNSEKSAAAANFLRDEYRLNHTIGAYTKPYVALTHAVVMGGGAGVSVHGTYRLADQSLAFAMPEMGIGFIPDIGASYFLSRCPGGSGLYLALTSVSIGLGDALALGLMTHHVAATDHDSLIARLADGGAPAKAIAALAQPAPPASLDRAVIDAAFSAPSVEAVLERLDRDGSDFAAKTASVIRTRSPTSLKLAFRLVREGKALSRGDCLKMEYRVAARRVMGEDFCEGVRAILIDKDGSPRWRPAALAEVQEADIAGYFENLGARELSFSGTGRG